MLKIKYWNIYKYLQPEKIKRIEKSLLLLKIRRIEKSLLLLKMRRIEKSVLLLKIRRTEKSLWLQKIRRIWEILASTEKQADLRNPCVYTKKWRTIESLRALKSPRLKKPVFEENPAGLEKQAAHLLFRLGGISSCWLLPGLADELSFRSS